MGDQLGKNVLMVFKPHHQVRVQIPSVSLNFRGETSAEVQLAACVPKIQRSSPLALANKLRCHWEVKVKHLWGKLLQHAKSLTDAYFRQLGETRINSKRVVERLPFVCVEYKSRDRGDTCWMWYEVSMWTRGFLLAVPMLIVSLRGLVLFAQNSKIWSM